MASNSEDVVNKRLSRLKSKDQVLDEILNEGDEVATSSNYTEVKDKAKRKTTKAVVSKKKDQKLVYKRINWKLIFQI